MKKSKKEIIEDKLYKIWDIIFDWADANPGKQSLEKAKKIDRVLRNLIKKSM
jgi:hypothetical protein